ncbi:MAG: hypothetical protein M3228_01550, partial [Actinomycetota bacterium]|nr:hypothetical protein [Actinomycetota bacterium]
MNQHHIAQALAEYYHQPLSHHGRYATRYGPDREGATSILTCPEWLDLGCPLLSPNDRLTLAGTVSSDEALLDGQAVDSAVQRLVETLALSVRLTNMPLYRLLDVDIKGGHIAGAVGVAPFVEYALTMDLLESELITTVATRPVRVNTPDTPILVIAQQRLRYVTPADPCSPNVPVVKRMFIQCSEPGDHLP